MKTLAEKSIVFDTYRELLAFRINNSRLIDGSTYIIKNTDASVVTEFYMFTDESILVVVSVLLPSGVVSRSCITDNNKNKVYS